MNHYILLLLYVSAGRKLKKKLKNELRQKCLETVKEEQV